MTKVEAQTAAAARNRDPAEAGSRWLPRQTAEGEWEVVRIKALPGMRGPLKTTTEAQPEPDPPDPRSPMDRNIGPWAPGAG